MNEIANAFGWPGSPPRWTSSAKDGVGTAIGAGSRVWFTLSHGIFNEIYYPRIDRACTRDMGLIVTNGRDFFSEEKRHAETRTEFLEPAIPVFRVTNTCRQGNYRIEKEILADPWRDAVLQRTRFEPLQENQGPYRLHVLLAPHLGNRGAGNTGWLGDYKGRPMLFAERDGIALALAASVPWNGRSVGFVGQSDGWQDLSRHKTLTWSFERAENGNVALVAEIAWDEPPDHAFDLVLGFGITWAEAAQRASASLFDGFGELKRAYLRGWRSYQATLAKGPAPTPASRRQARISATVLRVHESKRFPGGMIASLAIPWGFNKGDEDLGGYHLVWPRDLVESAGGLLACGARAAARDAVRYLVNTQEADGSWAQNLWLDGTPYWSGSQMDETAFPILLVDLARREGALRDGDVELLWPMMRRAASFIVRNGPVTQQDRWEEDPGYSPFTLAVEISALLVAAEYADAQGEADAAAYLRDTADAWNSSIERWTYVTGTDLARRLSIDGYYVRIAPAEVADGSSPLHGFVPIKNRPVGSNLEQADHIISPDALALARFGLRDANDPRICNTVQAIDALLKVDTPRGPAWHRYNDDGYGEHEDGGPFDGTGQGRVWPLLTGERGHFELAAGRRDEAAALLQALTAFAGETGLLPEQVWDSPDLPERELRFGSPSGSAMPLVWAHAEYLKLFRSIRDQRVFDMPPQTVQRYLVDKVESHLAVWRFNHKCTTLRRGQRLRVETLSPARVHWSDDGWRTSRDTPTRDTGLGVHIADLGAPRDRDDAGLDFTFLWTETDRWEQVDFHVAVTGD